MKKGFWNKLITEYIVDFTRNPIYSFPEGDKLNDSAYLEESHILKVLTIRFFDIYLDFSISYYLREVMWQWKLMKVGEW